MSEVELVPYKNYLIGPTPVRTQTAPGATEYRWRGGYYIYGEDRAVVKNRPGTPGFDTRDEARDAAVSEAKKLIDKGL